MLRQFNNN